MTEDIKKKLIESAEEAYKNAYVPYSNFRVGAAVLTKGGDIFTACNVENVSFGLTSCAERNAIFSAIAQQGHIEIQALAVATEHSDGASPCGACRQVISEFGPKALIYYKYKGQYNQQVASDMLPSTFNEIG